jgi:serine/threonine-protein kinase
MPDDLDALCADYLEQLRAALGDVERSDREQIIAQVSEHLSEARAALPTQNESSIRAVLERLGSPDDIAAAAASDRETERGSKRSSRLVWVTVGILVVVFALGGTALAGAFGGGPSKSPSASTPTRIPVPSVIGLSTGQATAQLQATGLKTRTAFQVNGTVPNGVVFEQSPKAGLSVLRSEAVTLAVSTGPAAGTVVVVPNVVGMSPSEAAAALQSVGLYNSIDNLNCSTRISSGDTVSEAPAPGSQVAKGTRISIQVACHP